jgi:hypothetical protein
MRPERQSARPRLIAGLSIGRRPVRIRSCNASVIVTIEMRKSEESASDRPVIPYPS